MSLSLDIRKHFPSFDLDVSLEAGDAVLGLLGASGCGKSLTMRCIAGIETPDEGRIVVNDTVFFDSAAKVNLTPQQRKTALLFQNYMLFPNLTVRQNVGAGIGRDVPAAGRDRLVEQELVRFDIAAFAKRYPAQLSGGQQQRVALARMLAARPGILMLDEPFSALDSHLKGVLEHSLHSLFSAYQGTIVYVSHDIDEALRFCDRIAVVEDGRVMEVQPGRELVRKPRSLAGIRLSGVKNAHECVRIDARTVHVPHWGVQLATHDEVPADVKALGVRAFFIQRASESGENVFRMRVDRVSDARFDRTALLRFLDHAPESAPGAGATQQQMRYLHQHLQWRVSLLDTPEADLPHEGDELLVRIPPEAIYLVSK